MSFLPANMKDFFVTIGRLMKPGDKISAEVTKSGNQVIKTLINGVKRSAVKYPSGTIVETIVHK